MGFHSVNVDCDNVSKTDGNKTDLESTSKSTPEGPLKAHEEGSLHLFDTQTMRQTPLRQGRRNKWLKTRRTGVSSRKASAEDRSLAISPQTDRHSPSALQI